MKNFTKYFQQGRNLRIKAALFFLMFFLKPLASYSQYAELYVPKIPENLSISMDPAVYNKLQESINSISTSKIDNIEKIYKEYLPAKIDFQGADFDEDCKAMMRLNGDWKDHIDAVNGRASLVVKLKKCYVGGISKFKLLLPNTRNGSNEIFWSMLLEEYGFPTLYTQQVNVNFNGKKYKALFQEAPSSAFLERHGIREAPIIENDERQLWIARTNWFYHAKVLNVDRHYSRTSPFKFWLDDDSFQYQAPSSFGRLDNPEFADNKLNSLIAMRGLSQFLNRENILNWKFYFALQKIWAPHGVVWHNQKFIYMPMTNSFIPLYYDGDVLMSPNEANAPRYLLDGCNAIVRGPGEHFEKEFTKRSGEVLTQEMRCTYQKISEEFSHLSTWENWRLNIEVSTENPPIKFISANPTKFSLQSGFKDLYVDMMIIQNGDYLVCKNFIDTQSCEVINEKRAHKILTDGEIIKFDKYKQTATVVAGELDPKVQSNGRMIEVAGSYIVDVKRGEKYYLYLPDGNYRKIDIHLQGPGSRVVAYGELGDSDSVSITGDAPNIFLDSRHDELMLTGCITFLNTKFNNPSLVSTATGCEDSINILNSTGKIKDINVKNATEDALDIDFSNLQIENIDVGSAGNDCLDISTGNYIIGTANLKNCGDKGVSAGEYANMKLDKAIVNGATLGLVAKDGAHLMVSEFKGSTIKEKCLDAYIKKKRFPIGHVYALSKSCEMASKPK